jgi:hypothetical protein
MNKLFDLHNETPITLSIEETFNIKKEIKKSDIILTNITALVNAINKDVGLNLTNELIFKVNPYKKYILEIDKLLSKTYGLNITHVPVNNIYSGYIKDSYLKDSFIKAIFDKNKDNILSDIKDDLPKVSNNKARGKKEQALTVFIKADFLDMVINHELTDTQMLNVILSEVQMILTELENMNDLLSDGVAMRETMLGGGIDKLYTETLGGSQEDIDKVSGTGKVKLVIDAMLTKYSGKNTYVNVDNPYVGNISNEDNDGRSKIPFGTRISYLLLLIIVITVIVALAAAGITNLLAIWYAMMAYLAYTVVYAIYRLFHIIIVGTDPKEVPEKRDTIVVAKDFLNVGNTESINNIDKDMNTSNSGVSNAFSKMRGMYNGKLGNEMMHISTESVFDDQMLNKLQEVK